MPQKIKKLSLGLAALGALALGGSALASAQNDATPTAPAPAVAAEQPGAEAQGAEASDATEKGGETSGEQQLTGPDTEQAKKAAPDSVGSGKVTDVSAEGADKGEAKDATETPDKGEAPDPAYEAQIAYDVEVTKAEGSVVDISLDKSFKVLGTEKADAGENGGQGEQADGGK